MEEPSETIIIADLLKIFKTKLCAMFVVVFTLSLILLYMPNLASTLMASSQNILSAFTSVFVHKDLTHVAANILLTLAILLLYSLSNTISGKRIDNFIVLAIWISAILASLAYVNITPNLRAAGSSGLVSAFLSGAMVTAYFNAWDDSVTRIKVIQSVIGALLLMAFIALNLNVDPNTVVAIHLSSFFDTAVLMLAKRFLSSFFSKTD